MTMCSSVEASADSVVDLAASDRVIVGAQPVNRPRRLTHAAMTNQARLRVFMVSPSPVAPDRQGDIGVFCMNPPKGYISGQAVRAELMGTRDNYWTIASRSMISGDLLNSYRPYKLMCCQVSSFGEFLH